MKHLNSNCKIGIEPILFQLLFILFASPIELESKQMNGIDSMMEPRAYLLKAIKAFGDDSYVTIDSFKDVPGQVFFHSGQWASEIFAEGSGPDDEPVKAARSYRPALEVKTDCDILKHIYDIHGMHVKIYEISTMLYVQVSNFDTVVHEEPDFAKRIAQLSTILFKIPAPLKFYKMSADSEGTLYSSNPDKTYTQMHNWWDRIDCVAKDSGMGFFIYKKSINIPRKPSPGTWFPDEMKNKKIK
jgi:hypothetical protein